MNGKNSVIDQYGKITMRGLLRFYVHRFLKIAPLYYGYCFLFEILSGNLWYWQNREVFFRMLTFTFHGIGGISGLGHLWYISMAMQLYFFMPFLELVIRILCKTKKQMVAVYLVTIGAGLGMRILFFKIGRDWQTDIYTNCFLNLDLVVSGMLSAKVNQWYADIIQRKYQVVRKALGWILFGMLVLYNCYIYWIGTDTCIHIYRYLLPTAYIISCTLLVLESKSCKRLVLESGGYSQCEIQNAFLLMVKTAVTKFSQYSYAFYIFHICVLEYLSRTMVQAEWFLQNSPWIQYIIYYASAIAMLLLVSVYFTNFANSIRLWALKPGKEAFRKCAEQPKCYPKNL